MVAILASALHHRSDVIYKLSYSLIKAIYLRCKGLSPNLFDIKLKAKNTEFKNK